MDQSVIDSLRAKAKEHRDYAEQIDTVAELAVEILGARPVISPVGAEKQRSKTATHKRGGQKTQNGSTRKRSAPVDRRPREQTRAEILTILQGLGPDEWFSPVLEAKKHARMTSAKYRYLRGSWQREAKVLVSEGVAEERNGVIPGKHGRRNGGSMLEYRLVKAQ